MIYSDSYKYIKIPEIIVMDKNLSHLSKLIFGRILSYYQINNVCFVSNKTLAKYFNVDIRTIQRCINQLYKNEYILINPNDNLRNGKSRYIYINFNKITW